MKCFDPDPTPDHWHSLRQRSQQIIVIHHITQQPQSQEKPDQVLVTRWMVFLTYLAYLTHSRLIQQERLPMVSVLRTLILAVALVLVVVALVAAGAPEVVANVLEHLPHIP